MAHLVGHMAHLVGHEKLHDAVSIRISHNTDNYVIKLKKKQPLRNIFLYDFDYSHISLMVGQDGQPLWKVVGHLAILHGKRTMASSNF